MNQTPSPETILKQALGLICFFFLCSAPGASADPGNPPAEGPPPESSAGGRPQSGSEEPENGQPQLNSCFQSLSKGRFLGNLSGLLVVEISNPKAAPEDPAPTAHLFPFENAAASLDLTPDRHEIYDVSTKRYSARLPQGELVYQLYNVANALSVTVGEDTYEYSVIDGGSDEGMDFLRCDFFRDDNNEYLVLVVTAPIRLTGTKRTPNEATLRPGSVLVFRMDRPQPPK